jgi:SAM-dependent methyltransferase
MLLGVTPAIATMRWPAQTHLVALDWCDGMFRNVFPREGLPPRCERVRGDWREMPVATASLDLVVGDGFYSTFPDLAGPAQVNREIARVLRAGGALVMRCHRRLDRAPHVADLFSRLFAGEIRDLDIFRFVLAMAVHGDSREGVRLDDVWRAWREHVPDSREAQSRYGWADAPLANIEGWKDVASRYFFPDLAQIRELATPAFDIEECEIPAYEWGEHFPRFTLRRSAA